MKTILILLVSTILLFPQQQKDFHIQKNNQGGFNFYNDTNELLYEFTKQNTDSSTLTTLDKIYSSAKYDSSEKRPIAVFNLENNGTDWSIIVVAFLGFVGTIGGLFLGNSLSKKSQLEQFHIEQRFQFKKEKLANLKEKYSVLMGKFMHMNNIILRYNNNIKSTDTMGREIFQQARNFLVNNTQFVEDMNKSLSDLNSLLHGTKQLNKEIADKISAITEKLDKFQSIQSDTEELNKLMQKFILETEQELI
jgi:hypothetical protein